MDKKKNVQTSLGESSCNFAWTRRDGNNLAHFIAKFASSSSYFVCNSENIPQVLLNA